MLFILLALFAVNTPDPGPVVETCGFLPVGTPCEPPPTCPASGNTLCEPIG